MTRILSPLPPQLLSPVWSSSVNSFSSSIDSNSTSRTTPSNAIHIRRICTVMHSSQGRSSNTSISRRRSAMSSSNNSSMKTPTEKASCSLQSTDKRRRYLRRGSKTANMMRGSFRVELPLHNMSSLKNNGLDDNDSTHSSSTASTYCSSSMYSSSGELLLSPTISTPSSSRHKRGLSFTAAPTSGASLLETIQKQKQEEYEQQQRLLRSSSSSSRRLQPPLPPFLQKREKSPRGASRKESTVSLLVSALALSSIHDMADTKNF